MNNRLITTDLGPAYDFYEGTSIDIPTIDLREEIDRQAFEQLQQKPVRPTIVAIVLSGGFLGIILPLLQHVLGAS